MRMFDFGIVATSQNWHWATVYFKPAVIGARNQCRFYCRVFYGAEWRGVA